MNCECTCLALQDVLLLIGLQGRTGELLVESGNNIGTMIFHSGAVLQAFSPYSRAIGDLLVEEGVITETELLATLHEQKITGVAPIGALFLKTGKVRFEAIEMMVHAQIRQAVNEFMTWQKLKISFVEKEVRPFDRIRLPVHEFIHPDVLQAAGDFFSAGRQPHEKEAGAPGTPTTA